MLLLSSLLFVLSLAPECQCEKKLKMVNVLYRHGARSPIHFYPNDVHKDYWSDGTGRLTQKGMRQEFDLGLFLRKRYIDTGFVNRSYLHKEVHIQSSDIDRCLQSAETQLSALYPPRGHQVWNTQIPWQPIPVHALPSNKDPVLRPEHDDCPRLHQLLEARKLEEDYTTTQKTMKDFLAKLSTYTGMELTFDNVWIVMDSIIAEETEGLEQPAWINENRAQLYSLSNWIFLSKYNKTNDELARLLGGPLLEKMISNMAQLQYHIPDEEMPYKLNLYSGHDTSLLAFAAGIDWQMETPTFASCILVELYQTVGEGLVVEMYHRNSNVLTPLKLKECAFSCPLSLFVQFTGSRVSGDRSSECGQVSGSRDPFKVMTIVFMMVSALLFLVLFLITFLNRRSKFVGRLWEGNDLFIKKEENI